MFSLIKHVTYLSTDYVEHWNIDGFKDYGNHISNMMPSDCSNVVTALAQHHTEVMENVHCRHDIGINDANQKQNSHVAIVHDMDVKLQQKFDGLGTNLFEIMLSLLKEKWDMFSKTCACYHYKTWTLEFRLPAVIWPIAVQYDLVLLQKMLRLVPVIFYNAFHSFLYLSFKK